MEHNGVPRGINRVIKVVDGFIQLLAVLVLLPLVIAKLLDKVYGAGSNLKRVSVQKLNTRPYTIRSFPCWMYVQPVPVYLVYAFWLCGVRYNKLLALYASLQVVRYVAVAHA